MLKARSIMDGQSQSLMGHFSSSLNTALLAYPVLLLHMNVIQGGYSWVFSLLVGRKG